MSYRYIRFPKEVARSGLIPYLWIVRGLSLMTVYDYCKNRTSTAERTFERYLRKLMNGLEGAELPVRLPFDAVIRFSDFAKRYPHIRRSAILRDFKWWCRREGLDYHDYYVRVGRERGYWLPAGFVEYWERVLLPQYEKRTVITEEVVAW